MKKKKTKQPLIILDNRIMLRAVIKSQVGELTILGYSWKLLGA